MLMGAGCFYIAPIEEGEVNLPPEIIFPQTGDGVVDLAIVILVPLVPRALCPVT